MLTAWRGGRLVGSGCLRWEGPFNADMAVRFPQLVELAFLQIDPEFRCAGIGSRLMSFGEAEARSRRETAMGLAAGRGNQRARSLYERRGYVATGDVQRDRYTDNEGQQVQEESAYFIKML